MIAHMMQNNAYNKVVYCQYTFSDLCLGHNSSGLNKKKINNILG